MDRRKFIKKSGLGLAILSLTPSAIIANTKISSLQLKNGKAIIPHIRHGLLNLNLLGEEDFSGPSWLKTVEVNDFYKSGFKSKSKGDVIRIYSYLIDKGDVLESIQVNLEVDKLEILNENGFKKIKPSSDKNILFKSDFGEIDLFYTDKTQRLEVQTKLQKSHFTLLKGKASVQGQELNENDQLIISSNQLIQGTFEAGSIFIIAR